MQLHKNTTGGRKGAREGVRHVKGQGNVWAVVVASSVGQPDSVAPWYVGCLFKIVSSVSLKQPNLAYYCYCYTCSLLFLPVVQYILQKPAKRKSIKDVGEFIALPATCYTASSPSSAVAGVQPKPVSQPASKQASGPWASWLMYMQVHGKSSMYASNSLETTFFCFSFFVFLSSSSFFVSCALLIAS